MLTLRLPDSGRMLGLPGALARPLAARTQQVNEVIDAVSERFGALVFDAEAAPESYQRRMWAADRLHPNERGHRHIARSFHRLLAEHGHQVGAPPCAEPSSPPPSRLAVLAWLATKGTAWVLRRSTDLVPYLVAMAAREMLRSASQAGPWRSAWRLDAGILGQPPQQAGQNRGLLVGDAAPELPVEGDGGFAKPAERLLPRGGQLDDVHPPVGRVAAPGEQPGPFHRVEMVGERCLADADRSG